MLGGKNCESGSQIGRVFFLLVGQSIEHMPRSIIAIHRQWTGLWLTNAGDQSQLSRYES